MKKAITLIFILFFTLSGCGGSSQPKPDKKTESQAPTIQQFSQVSIFEREEYTFNAEINDPDNVVTSYDWVLVSENIEIDFSFNKSQLSFNVPEVIENSQVAFNLTIKDHNNNEVSEILTVDIQAYKNVSIKDDFIDKELLNCLIRTNKDYGAEEISCDQYLIRTMDDLTKFDNLSALSLTEMAILDTSALARISSLKKLELTSQCVSNEVCYGLLQGLDYHTELVELKIRMNAYYATWDFSKLNKLERLSVSDVYGIAASLNINTLPKSLTELSLDLLYVQNPQGLALLTNLTKLSLSHGGVRSRLTNFSIIENLTKLTELNIDAGDADLSPLTNLVALKSLSLAVSNDISTLYKLKNVKELSLQFRDSALNLSKLLDNLENLETLDIAGTEIELSNEFNMHNTLKSLSLSMSGSNKLTNIDFISKLDKLEKLTLGSVGEVELSPLETLTHLKSINISAIEFSDFPDLSGSKTLTEVKLSGNEGLNSIDGLTKLVNLKHLSLGDMSGLSSISSLSRLENLNELHLYNPKIDGLFSTVGQQTQLKELSIIKSKEGYPASKDVFTGLLKLEKLSLNDVNNFDSFDGLINLPNLQSIETNSLDFPCQSIETMLAHRPDIQFVQPPDRQLIWDANGYTQRVSGYCIKQPVDYEIITDVKLKECVAGIKDVAKVTELKCGDMGIVSLQGIEQFGSLKVLYLYNNEIIDPLPLLELDAIEFVDFSGNTELDCNAFEQVIKNSKFVDLFKPTHCQ